MAPVTPLQLSSKPVVVRSNAISEEGCGAVSQLHHRRHPALDLERGSQIRRRYIARRKQTNC
jgi:hypothetical protein